MDELPSGADSRVGILVVEAYGHGEEEEEEEDHPGQGIGDELAPCQPGQDQVEDGVGGKEPEVDDGVASVPEEGSGQKGV